MKDGWFIEIDGLQFSDLTQSGFPAGLDDCLEPWLPPSTGVRAAFHNHRPGAQSFDYIIVTDALVYFFILFSEGGACGLRSVKTFRICRFDALAHMMAPCPGEGAEGFPHVRIMLHGGERIKLAFTPGDSQLPRRLQQLAQTTFFKAGG